jgi:hypothetical protein
VGGLTSLMGKDHQRYNKRARNSLEITFTREAKIPGFV